MRGLQYHHLVSFSQFLALNFAHHTLVTSKKLISIAKFCEDNKAFVELYSSCFLVFKTTNEKIELSPFAHEMNALYHHMLLQLLLLNFKILKGKRKGKNLFSNW